MQPLRFMVPLLIIIILLQAPHTVKGKPLTKQLCEDVFDNHEGETHEPFGDIWNKYLKPEVYCPDIGSRKEAIAQVTREGCAVNWREGKVDKTDSAFVAAGAHETPSTGPAVLGFDRDLDDYCKRENTGADASCNHHNRLYLKQWTLCKNMKWLLCAGMGLLPGQDGIGSIVMVTPISAVDADRMATPEDLPKDAPPLTASEKEDYEDEQHRVPEAFGVTVHEVCTLHRMCSNGDDIFDVAREDTFTCENPKIPFDMLTDPTSQVMPGVAEEGAVPADLSSAETSRFRAQLRQNLEYTTLAHANRILEKELDQLEVVRNL